MLASLSLTPFITPSLLSSSQTLSSAAVGSIVGLQSEEILQVASQYEEMVSLSWCL